MCYGEIYEFKSFGMLSQVYITALPHARNPDLKWDLHKLVTFWLYPMELQKKKFAANLNFMSNKLLTANDNNDPCYLLSENYYQHMSFIRGKIRWINIIYVVSFVHNNTQICITLVCGILAANAAYLPPMKLEWHTWRTSYMNILWTRYILMWFTLILF